MQNEFDEGQSDQSDMLESYLKASPLKEIEFNQPSPYYSEKESINPELYRSRYNVKYN